MIEVPTRTLIYMDIACKTKVNVFGCFKEKLKVTFEKEEIKTLLFKTMESLWHLKV